MTKAWAPPLENPPKTVDSSVPPSCVARSMYVCFDSAMVFAVESPAVGSDASCPQSNHAGSLRHLGLSDIRRCAYATPASVPWGQ